MEPEKAVCPSIALRCCNAWAWTCIGFTLGFGVCAMLAETGWRAMPIHMMETLIWATMPFVAIIPRTILEIAYRVQKYRKLAQGSPMRVA